MPEISLLSDSFSVLYYKFKNLNRWQESNKKYDLMANIISDPPMTSLLFFFLKVYLAPGTNCVH